MPTPEERPYTVPKDLLDEAKRTAYEFGHQLEYVESKYLVLRKFRVGLSDESSDITSIELLDFLKQAGRSQNYVNDSAPDPTKPTRPPVVTTPPEISLQNKVGKVLLDFVLRFYEQIRDLICKGRKVPGATTHTVIVALAVWLSQHAGINQPAVTALATAIMMAVATATKGAFCEMTAEAAKQAIAATKAK
jgi:hypothetical protein